MTQRDDWSPAIGLRRGAISLICRSAIALSIWCGVLWLVAPGFTNPNFTPGLGLIIAGAIPPAFVIGWLMSWRLTEQAGFTSMIIIAMVVLCAVGVVAGGSALVEHYRPFADAYVHFMIDGVTSAIALGFSAFFLLRES